MPIFADRKVERSVRHYMGLPYRVRLQQNGLLFFASIEELSLSGDLRCEASGCTQKAAIASLRNVQRNIIKNLVQKNQNIPLPESENEKT